MTELVAVLTFGNKVATSMSGNLFPLHIPPTASQGRSPVETLLLEGLLACSFILASVLVVLSGFAFRRRKTRSALLLCGAFLTILGHSIVAIFMLEGIVSDVIHHLIEHALIIVQSMLVLAAIYYSRELKVELHSTEEPTKSKK